MIFEYPLLRLHKGNTCTRVRTRPVCTLSFCCCTSVLSAASISISISLSHTPRSLAMVHPKRTRTSSWFLGACVVSSAVHGGAGYLIPATSFFSAADRSERCLRQDDSFRGNRIAAVPRAAAALWRVAPQQARRQEKSITMKQKQARKKTTRVRPRRAGPRTDVEGYSHSAFRELILVCQIQFVPYLQAA